MDLFTKEPVTNHLHTCRSVPAKLVCNFQNALQNQRVPFPLPGNVNTKMAIWWVVGPCSVLRAGTDLQHFTVLDRTRGSFTVTAQWVLLKTLPGESYWGLVEVSDEREIASTGVLNIHCTHSYEYVPFVWRVSNIVSRVWMSRFALRGQWLFRSHLYRPTGRGPPQLAEMLDITFS